MEIGNLEEFIYQIKTIDQCEDGYVRFYRGQPVDKPLIPNAFRDQCFIDNESDIYNEIVNKKPGEFTNCKCTFDYLVKMQHYNIPTRLLDITTNPLVALYFACSGEPDEHAPTVYCIDIPFDRIKNYTSDSVTILSSLARYDKYSKDLLLTNIYDLNFIRGAFVEDISSLDLKVVEGYCMLFSALEDSEANAKASDIFESVKSALLKYPYSYPANQKYRSYFADERADERIKTIIKEIFTHLAIIPDYLRSNQGALIFQIKSALNKYLSHIEDPRLLHEVKQDKPYFLDKMHIDTFNTIYCVKPRLDNPRIIKQNGAFLIFPHAKIKLEDDIRTTKISIDKKIMTSIKEDLSKIDINEESLFDDMDTVCLAIKDRYRKLNK